MKSKKASKIGKKIDISRFKYLIDLVILLLKETSGKNTDKEELVIASNFLSKTAQSCLSIWCMIIDYPKNIFNKRVYDFPSALILLRTVIESYVNFYYLLVEPRDKEERELRILLFNRHSLYERKKMLNCISTPNDKISKIDTDIEIITKNIKKNIIYKTSDKGMKDSLENIEKWCRKEYENFGKRADLTEFNNDTIKVIHKFLSNYVHSYPLSLEQINTAFNEKEIYGIIELIIDNSTIFLSLTLDLFAQVNKEAKYILEKEQHFSELVTIYKDFISADLKTIRIEE